MLHGILIGIQCYLNPLIIPDLHSSDPHANIHNYIQYDLLHDSEFAYTCNKEFWRKWKELTPKKDSYLHLAIKKLTRSWFRMIPFGKIMIFLNPNHTLHLQDDTKKLLYYHQIGHNCYQYLYNFHKYIDGVPNFSNTTSKVLDQCLTCIQVKTYQNPPVHGTTRVSTQLYQGLSIDFAFYGIKSDEIYRKIIYKWINGETW